jgi:TonB family protein
VETFDRHEPNGKALMGSIATHIAVAGLFLAMNVFHFGEHWGAAHASSGSIGIQMVSTIPIPRNEGRPNPLANQTKNIVPQETMQVKPKPEVKAPDPKAIELSGKVEKKKFTPKPIPPSSVFKPQPYQPNQLYAKSAQALNSPMFGIQGSGGIDVGPASVLGTRYEAYTNLMRQVIAQHWNRADVRALPSQKAAVAFTIARSGAVSNVRISHPSGNRLLDDSGMRAILDSNPLPSLPRDFTGNDVTVEIWFQLTQ